VVGLVAALVAVFVAAAWPVVVARAAVVAVVAATVAVVAADEPDGTAAADDTESEEPGVEPSPDAEEDAAGSDIDTVAPAAA
jgi:hypothetical protein